MINRKKCLHMKERQSPDTLAWSALSTRTLAVSSVAKILRKLGLKKSRNVPAPQLVSAPILEGLPDPLTTPHRLLIGPTNSAGQGFRWASAVTQHVPGASAHSFRLSIDERSFPVDYRVAVETFRHDLAWRATWTATVLERYTHVLIESNRPIFGAQPERSVLDAVRLREAGIAVAMIAHGSDVRAPSIHNELEEWSQFRHMDPKLVSSLEAIAQENLPVINGFDGPVFVSTLALLDFVPKGIWCPLVIDVDQWRCDDQILIREKPVVAHVPSSVQKGSFLFDPILEAMATEGVIDYLRVSGVHPDGMPAIIKRADIVVDLLGEANYGVATCEAMAAGKPVVSHVSDRVRERVKERTGLDLPVVEATPPTMDKVIRDLISDRDQARDVARKGVEFVRAIHDGRKSAEALQPFLDGSLTARGV